jgi:malonyl-CoA/methylmalonyl-CoA synthetase
MNSSEPVAAWPNMYAEIARAVAARPQATALENENGERYSYRELDEWSARYANRLVGLGLQRGDRVAVQVEKTAQSLFLYLACLRAGLVYLPLNTAYQRSELEYFLRDAQPGLVVGSPGDEALLRKLAGPDSRTEVLSLDERGSGSFAQHAERLPAWFDTVAVDGDELAVLIYTSGTTGRAKGAMVTHRNLVSNARALNSIWAFSEHDVLLHALPIFHVHGLFVANHCALSAGASMLWQRKFDVRAVVNALPRASVFMGVPTFYVRLLSDPDFGSQPCASMRLFISGSAPLLPETFRAFERRTGHRILERYGMSEAGMISSNPLDAERRAGTVGRALPGVSLRVADSQDRELPAGHTGGIQVRGDNVFRGYWRMPEKTREEFTAEGWFRTGDLGVIDGDGYLSIVGREKDLIISGGYNVYPKEIELVLDGLEGVAESAVIGVPHPEFGEAVTAIVVAKPGATLDPDGLVAQLRKNFANYKVPKRVYLVDDLPRNAMGKVQKAMLRKRYGGAG